MPQMQMIEQLRAERRVVVNATCVASLIEASPGYFLKR